MSRIENKTCVHMYVRTKYHTYNTTHRMYRPAPPETLGTSSRHKTLTWKPLHIMQCHPPLAHQPISPHSRLHNSAWSHIAATLPSNRQDERDSFLSRSPMRHRHEDTYLPSPFGTRQQEPNPNLAGCASRVSSPWPGQSCCPWPSRPFCLSGL